jgi:diaminopimelate epimerase
VIQAAVDMGEVGTLPEPADWHRIGADPMRPVSHLTLGNPHTVVGVEEVGAVDLAALGAIVPYVNLEIVEPGPELHAITMRVHERGAGITEACGTGACASAWAASAWGLVPSTADEILVHMDGGDARVRMHHPSPGRVTLVGPAQFIGTVSVEI